ncbi:MAG: hypothetical protein WBQ73_04295 [Candidatus Babeliales bacterium]
MKMLSFLLFMLSLCIALPLYGSNNSSTPNNHNLPHKQEDVLQLKKDHDKINSIRQHAEFLPFIGPVAISCLAVGTYCYCDSPLPFFPHNTLIDKVTNYVIFSAVIGLMSLLAHVSFERYISQPILEPALRLATLKAQTNLIIAQSSSPGEAIYKEVNEDQDVFDHYKKSMGIVRFLRNQLCWLPVSALKRTNVLYQKNLKIYEYIENSYSDVRALVLATSSDRITAIKEIKDDSIKLLFPQKNIYELTKENLYNELITLSQKLDSIAEKLEDTAALHKDHEGRFIISPSPNKEGITLNNISFFLSGLELFFNDAEPTNNPLTLYYELTKKSNALRAVSDYLKKPEALNELQKRTSRARAKAEEDYLCP